MRRRSEFTDFEAEGVFELIAPLKSMKMNGTVFFSDDSDWEIRLTGPLGIEIADISTKGDEYLIRSNLMGGSRAGSLTDPIEVPGFEVVIPELRTLTCALMPVLDIQKSENWKLQPPESGSDCDMSLVKSVGNDEHELLLQLSYSPLRVIKEIRIFNGKPLYQRDYEYRSKKSAQPSEISIFTGDMQLNIRYHSLRFNVLSMSESKVEILL